MTDRKSTNEQDGRRTLGGGPSRAGRCAVFAVAALFAGALAGDTQAKGSAYPSRGQRAVVAAALKSFVPPELALAVARVGRDLRLAAADAPRAVGIMQVLPSVVRAELGLRAYDLGGNRANAGVGVALLERLYRRHGERWDLALSHYRGGPLPQCEGGAVAHAHTVEYVASVMEWWRRYQKEGTVAVLTGEARKGANGRTAPDGARVPSSGAAALWERFRSDDRPVMESGRPRRFF